MEQHSSKLDYGRENRRRFRWPQIRRVAWIVLTVAVIWYAVTQVPALVRQFRCARYAIPPENVVYDDDPAATAKLLSLPDYGEVMQLVGPFPMRAPPVGRISPSAYPIGGYRNGFETGTVFLHTRRTFVGDSERLVFVSTTLQTTPGGYDLWLCLTSLVPRSVMPGSSVEEVVRDGYRIAVPRGQRLRLFAGQPDPTDPTHFTFDYELGGSRGTIDGWLREDSIRGIALRARGGIILHR